MTLRRRHRILTALIALFGMLFMQLAIASHACQGMPGNGSRQSTLDNAASMRAMPDCDQPDPVPAALCHAHCLDGKTSLDKPQTPVAAPAAVIVSTILHCVEPPLMAACSGATPDFALRRIASPPIAIRHCCFRI
jgi:hypothetical protein